MCERQVTTNKEGGVVSVVAMGSSRGETKRIVSAVAATVVALAAGTNVCVRFA